MSLTIGSLFSGIGGFELGLERAGVGRVLWQVEKNEYCRAVLAKHWPDAKRYEDVLNVGSHNLEPVDVICGGFPCQDISFAGGGEGLDGEESRLWFEYARIIRELRPRYVGVENVAALLGRGLGDVLGELAASGYDAEWSVVSACSVGAPHTRERMFIVGYAEPHRWDAVPHVGADRVEREDFARSAWQEAGAVSAHRFGDGLWCLPASRAGWLADGISTGVEQLGAYGNAVSPFVAEIVGGVILDLESQRAA